MRNIPSYDICIQERIIVTIMVLHNFIRAYEDNDIGQGLSKGAHIKVAREVITMK